MQLTSDGHKMYLQADAFAGAVDFAQLVKVYGAAPEGAEVRYSPVECLGYQKTAVHGAVAPTLTRRRYRNSQR